MRHSIASWAGVLLWFVASVGKAQPAPQPITQRDINVMAAGLEDARSILIDNAGLRQPGEDLHSYLHRIALPLRTESPTIYKMRIQRYLALLVRSVEITQSRRRIPSLRDTSTANLALWEHTVHALQQFPTRVKHTQAAWQNAQYDFRRSYKTTTETNIRRNAQAAQFDSELAQTVSLLIALDDELRDVRP